MKEIRKMMIQKHRDMWNWMADKVDGKYEHIDKMTYFRENNIPTNEIPKFESYCCAYASMFVKAGGNKCNYCPLNFSKIDGEYHACEDKDSWYYDYMKNSRIVNNMKPEVFTDLCRKIANVQERDI